MYYYKFIFIFIFPFSILSTDLFSNDSLPITGHFFRSGKYISRNKVEKLLLSKDTSLEYVDKSLGYKWSGHAIGALLWTINTGFCAYQLYQLYKVIENCNIIVDTSKLYDPFASNFSRYIIPITIFSQIASFIQVRLYNRSDYFLHKGLLAYNSSIIAKKQSKPIDLTIKKINSREYSQGEVIFYEPVLYGILLEEPKSRYIAVWSWFFKECGIQSGVLAGNYLIFAVVPLLYEYLGNSSYIIDKKTQRQNFIIGISLLTTSITTSIISKVLINKAINKYNGKATTGIKENKM
jgi:hypothetical protein